MLVFDNGYFSEFGTFSVTDWLGHTPRDMLAKNLGLPETAFETFPKEEVYFARGPVPPPEQQPPLQGTLKSPPDTHKFRMLEQEPHSIHAGGREWRVGADLFPISRTITGVILDLEPGGLRELHWHPNADEWQYVISGSVRVTMFGSHGRYRIETLDRGDVGYIPTGYGHSIENTSDGKPARVLIAFNSGHYEAIDLSTWLASNPGYLLAANFEQPRSLVEELPRDRVFLASKEGPAKHVKDKDEFPKADPKGLERNNCYNSSLRLIMDGCPTILNSNGSSPRSCRTSTSGSDGSSPPSRPAPWATAASAA